MSLIDNIVRVESGGNPAARNPRSSATGPSQFIDSTWMSMMQKYRPDLIQGMGRDEILAMRTNPELSREMTANYANENKGILSQAGLPVTDGTAYLAHFAGPQGAVKVLQADPSAPVGGILGDAVVKANPFLANMTAGDLAAWANKKMGVSGSPEITPDIAPKLPQAAPQGILAQPPRPQGLMAAAPQAAPQGLMAPPTASAAPPGGMSAEDVAAFMAPMKPIQHLIPPRRPARLAMRG